VAVNILTAVLVLHSYLIPTKALESSGRIPDMTFERQVLRASETKENPNQGMMFWMYRLTGR
jgi:hypothetical protein